MIEYRHSIALICNGCGDRYVFEADAGSALKLEIVARLRTFAAGDGWSRQPVGIERDFCPQCSKRLAKSRPLKGRSARTGADLQ